MFCQTHWKVPQFHVLKALDTQLPFFSFKWQCNKILVLVVSLFLWHGSVPRSVCNKEFSEEKQKLVMYCKKIPHVPGSNVGCLNFPWHEHWPPERNKKKENKTIKKKKKTHQSKAVYTQRGKPEQPQSRLSNERLHELVQRIVTQKPWDMSPVSPLPRGATLHRSVILFPHKILRLSKVSQMPHGTALRVTEEHMHNGA